MAKKLLPNRISKTVPPDAESIIRQAFQMIFGVLGEPTSISPEEYKALPKIADKRKQECDDVFAIMKENPELVEPPLSIDETQKDKSYYEMCDFIRGFKTNLDLLLDTEQNIAGAEYYNGLSVYEEDVENKANRSSNIAQNVNKQLKAVNRNRGGNSGNKKDDGSKKS